MAGSSFGKAFIVSTFGESHGSGIGVVIDGCPAGLNIDQEFIQSQLDRRKPGQSHISTPRSEKDKLQILSGVLNDISTGAPIAIWIGNFDQHSQDYDHIKQAFRPSHADYTYFQKYGLRDHRGGGRSSARETAARVAAGSIAALLCRHFGITILGYVSSIGNIALTKYVFECTLDKVDQTPVRCPDLELAKLMEKNIIEAKEKGDSLGGNIHCIIEGVKPGLGEPVFDRLEADLAKAMLSINAVKAFEIGSGFAGTTQYGSEHNDPFTTTEDGSVRTTSNNSGGVQGGISNGMPIYFRVGFKPTSTILQSQQSINEKGEAITIEGKGRHDPCVVPRAVPIVESMAALVIADHVLRNRTSRLDIML